jgi:putative membrane protein insertion efficiency factor
MFVLRTGTPGPRIDRMVFIWRGGGRRRGFGPGYGPGGGYGPGRGWGGPPPGYGYRRGYGGGGGSCLRDLLFLDAGCCLAESLSDGCLLALGPTLLHAHRAPRGAPGLAGRMVAAIRVYQREVSPRRPPVCRFEPTCSAYAVQAIEEHGAGRGAWLTARRLLRCRPGAVGGADPVPAAAA